MLVSDHINVYRRRDANVIVNLHNNRQVKCFHSIDTIRSW
jgi:hypothetical protein